MGHLVAGMKRRYFFTLILLTIFLFFIVFLPMRNQLKTQAAENYNLLAESKLQTVTGLINASLTSARSLSSRTAIRDNIVDYTDGRMTWSSLIEQTYPNYLDGVKPIENLEFAVRYAGGTPLLIHNLTNDNPGNYTTLFPHPMEVQYKFRMHAGQTKIIAYSPIIYNDRLIGSDVIVVNITEQIEELEKDGFYVKILEPQSPLLKKLVPEQIVEKFLYNHRNYTCVIKAINADYALFVSKPNSEVFRGANRVSLLSIAGFTLGLCLVFVIVHAGVVKLANGMIQEIKGSRDTYMNYANYDMLTGTYTRVFFENWMEKRDESFRNNQYVIGMIDIDRFKWINDTFGHKTGDDVLKFFADILMETLRENDFVFRFGGDEFIVIFENISTDRVLKIFSRIERVMQDFNPFSFEISISYGVELVESLDNIYESIHSTIEKADKKMYRSKNEK